jgi:Zn-finger nucleic acid-binding protein
MQAETLNCPNCGAGTSSESPQCQFCGSRLATIACASCFGMMFIGSKHCQRCGAAGAFRETVGDSTHKCPRCSIEMQPVRLGSTSVQECERCHGLWLDVRSFESICASREQQAAVPGGASPAPQNSAKDSVAVKYVPCPQCAQLMNRINFARCSGVIVDVCKGHGTWFDREELSRIVEFIRDGGLEAARQKEKAQIREERQRLRDEQMAASDISRSMSTGLGDFDEGRISGIASVRDLLKFLLD